MGAISRCAGIATGTAYLCGDGYTGKTAELDAAVANAAKILAEMYGTDVEIRFNHNRESGGAFVRDGQQNCSIGLGARQYTAEMHNNLVREAEHESCEALKAVLQENVTKNAGFVGKITYDAKIDTSIAKTDIDGALEFRWWDFDTLEEAAAFLRDHCAGINGVCQLLEGGRS